LPCHQSSPASRQEMIGVGHLAGWLGFRDARRIRGRSQTRITVRARTTEATGSPCPALGEAEAAAGTSAKSRKRPRFNRRLNIGGFTCNLARTGPTFESCGDADNMKGSGLASSRESNHARGPHSEPRICTACRFLREGPQ
jgi:hypothetical protein